MIMNSDIYPDRIDGMSLMEHLSENSNTIYALTRHEHDFSRRMIRRYRGSHDAFLFKSPVKRELLDKVGHPQNVWGSENVVLYELVTLNYDLANPCRRIIIVHEHASRIRESHRKRISVRYG